MRILIIFGTVEGQTAKIARFLADEARGAGHDVDLIDTADKSASISAADADKVILAASVHERKHPKWFEMCLAAEGDKLAARDTMLLSVSLMAAFPDTRSEAQEFVEEMKMRTGFEPATEMLVAGAVRMSSYDYFSTQVLRHVVLRGGKYDLAEGDHEFTDWEGLKTALSAFLAA
ncbi:MULTISPECIES: flavodoxin domain-containing protein [unclassified Roseovarius]|uniref:flavodoxin domain-containing protein n=1 Tax=unclassified Roseovarius TaxID=2614913 RepID=UPI00273F0038|nr:MULTISPECIES: flavodoxin domain-containing protein [unclassified Roseovarius]